MYFNYLFIDRFNWWSQEIVAIKYIVVILNVQHSRNYECCEFALVAKWADTGATDALTFAAGRREHGRYIRIYLEFLAGS